MTVTDWQSLRLKHPRLHYQQAQHRLSEAGLELEFTFLLEPDITFKPRLVFTGVTQEHLAQINPTWLETMVFSLGLVELLSYWKVACPPEISIEAGYLNPDQITWWQTLLKQGLGEFFFVNQITFNTPDFVRWQVAGPAPTQAPPGAHVVPLPEDPSILIPIGGGKDSVVSLEVLKTAVSAEKLGVLHIKPTQAAQETRVQSGIKPSILVERYMDPMLAELNQAGYLNGHTPFSALAAFITTLSAGLFGYDLIAVSNERSSNEGNVQYLGQEINHQYSKTYAFEHDFQNYMQTYLSPWWTAERPQPFYFSFLRPLFELQIAQLFAQSPDYFPIFRSCNVGHATNSWCGKCPKCLFAYSILAPFLPTTTLESVFGHSLLNDLTLLPLAKQLAGQADQKPFECVGTHEETILAWHLTLKRYQKTGEPIPALLQELQRTILVNQSQLDERAQRLLGSWNTQHSLPQKLEQQLKKQLEEAQTRLAEAQPL